MHELAVQYPALSSGISESDLEVLNGFHGILAQNSVSLFLSTANPEWVIEAGEYTSPLCCLKIRGRTVLRRTVAELRAMTPDAFRDALVEASRTQDRG